MSQLDQEADVSVGVPKCVPAPGVPLQPLPQPPVPTPTRRRAFLF